MNFSCLRQFIELHSCWHRKKESELECLFKWRSMIRKNWLKHDGICIDVGSGLMMCPLLSRLHLWYYYNSNRYVRYVCFYGQNYEWILINFSFSEFSDLLINIKTNTKSANFKIPIWFTHGIDNISSLLGLINELTGSVVLALFFFSPFFHAKPVQLKIMRSFTIIINMNNFNRIDPRFSWRWHNLRNITEENWVILCILSNVLIQEKK